MSAPGTQGGSPIVVAPGALDRIGELVARHAPAHATVVVTDTNVAPLYAERVRAALAAATGGAVHVIAIPAGEVHKTRTEWARVTDRMLELECGRDTTVVALGGGVVGDLAGFVAATFMRGVPVVQVPTTLLAMVDAAVGGKTAVDTPAGKNLVGAFHQPAVVVADPEVLATLPARERRAGMAEVIKHGVVADAEYFDAAVRLAPAVAGGTADPDALASIVEGSIAIKSAVVADDEREGGRRKVLNFGHTIGHAVETACGYALLHGEAVAAGMVAEALLAERLGVARAGVAVRVADAVREAGLPDAIPPELDAARLLPLMRLDKKARRGLVECALPDAIGSMSGERSGWAVPVHDEDLAAAIGLARRDAPPGAERAATG